MTILPSKTMFVLLLIGSLWGCTALAPAPTSLTAPFFTPTAEDSERIAKITPELANRELHCHEASTCEQVHFTRALVSLFENQETARASFHRVIDDYPSGDFSASSRLWLQVIEDHEIQSNPRGGSQDAVLQLMAQHIRDWMTRELIEPAKQTQANELITPQHTMADSSGVIGALQKQVRERDRRIATLQSQMAELKLIDQDHEQRKRPIRLPGTLP
jgi:hypothetical protein